MANISEFYPKTPRNHARPTRADMAEKPRFSDSAATTRPERDRPKRPNRDKPANGGHTECKEARNDSEMVALSPVDSVIVRTNRN